MGGREGRREGRRDGGTDGGREGGRERKRKMSEKMARKQFLGKYAKAEVLHRVSNYQYTLSATTMCGHRV